MPIEHKNDVMMQLTGGITTDYFIGLGVSKGISKLRKSFSMLDDLNGFKFIDGADANGVFDDIVERTTTTKSWKEIIDMPSSPHMNKTPGHWFAMKRKAVTMAKSGEYEEIYLNKGLSNVLEPGIKPNRRPDILGLRSNGLVDQFEVPSKTDNIFELLKRMRDNQNILGNKAGDMNILPIK